MNCVICKTGETAPGYTSVTLERGRTTIVFKDVPAKVCNNCGEGYVAAPITRQLLETADEAVRMGVQFDVRSYSEVPA